MSNIYVKHLVFHWMAKMIKTKNRSCGFLAEEDYTIEAKCRL